MAHSKYRASINSANLHTISFLTTFAGKRNTSLAFFTAHERDQLKSTWGSRSTQLTRDSFLPFSACRLCLLPAIDPIACAGYGDLFCRACAVENLVKQNAEIKRIGREAARRLEEQAEDQKCEEGAALDRSVREFEEIQAGLRKAGKADSRSKTERDNAVRKGASDHVGQKRKFRFDEEELLKLAEEDRGRAKRALSEERVRPSTAQK